MLLLSLVYNFVMLGCDTLVALAGSRRKHPATIALMLTETGIGALILAVLVAPELFAAMRLLSFGLFIHLPLIAFWGALRFRRTHFKSAIMSALLALSVILIGVDAFWFEPTWLEVSHVTIQSNKVDQPWRLVLVADLQTDQFRAYERDILETIMRFEPDMILMAGDYLQVAAAENASLQRTYNQFLRELGFAAKRGVFAVGGNTDAGDWEKIFDGVPVRTLVQTETCRVGDVSVTGLSIRDSFDTQLQIPGESAFHIVLGHAPDFALGRIDADLLLAGHTHGGQVRLPGIGPLLTMSRVPRAWAAGRTDLAGDQTLIVSRGLGMERGTAPRLRFLCRPELVVIELQPRHE